MAHFNILRLFLVPLLSSLLVLLMPANARSQRSEIIPFEHWNCGANDFDKSLSHQLSKEDCPKRMYEADLCCVVHDICYMDEKRSQQECDEGFCHCLERTVAQAARASNSSSASGCETVSNSFCEIVKLFGGIAYSTARKLANNQKTALKAWETALAAEKEAAMKGGSSSVSAKTSTPVPSPSSDSPSIPPSPPQSTPTPTPTPSSSSFSSSTSGSTASPAEIGHFVSHQFPLTCFDDTLSKCTKRLQLCTSRHFNSASDGQAGDALVLGAQLAECSAEFCECASQEWKQPREGHQRENSPRWTLVQLARHQRDECAQSLASICSQFGEMPAKGQGNVNFWSVNVNYIGQPISLLLAMLGSLLLLLFLAIFVFLLLKLVSLVKRRFCMDESIRKNYAKSSIRRNTLTALRGVSGANDDDVERGGGPHYIPFGHHQKESTVSSPSESEPAAHKLLGNGHGHHHKKAHSDVAHNKNLLHSPHPHAQNLPLNSSQVHLIAGTGNSSSTLSDISSS